VASSSVAAGDLLQETRLQTNPLHALLQASDSRPRGGRAGGHSANLQEFPKPGPHELKAAAPLKVFWFHENQTLSATTLETFQHKTVPGQLTVPNPQCHGGWGRGSDLYSTGICGTVEGQRGVVGRLG
jgi:hypothetical protein